MPVLIERPKMTRTMYMALKRHILQEGERKKKEQRMEADAEAERLRKEREEASLRLRQQQLQQQQEDNLTIEQLASQIAELEKKLQHLKDQKHHLFTQLKNMLNVEDETRKRQAKAAAAAAAAVEGLTSQQRPTYELVDPMDAASHHGALVHLQPPQRHTSTASSHHSQRQQHPPQSSSHHRSQPTHQQLHPSHSHPSVSHHAHHPRSYENASFPHQIPLVKSSSSQHAYSSSSSRSGSGALSASGPYGSSSIHSKPPSLSSAPSSNGNFPPQFYASSSSTASSSSAFHPHAPMMTSSSSYERVRDRSEHRGGDSRSEARDARDSRLERDQRAVDARGGGFDPTRSSGSAFSSYAPNHHYVVAAAAAAAAAGQQQPIKDARKSHSGGLAVPVVASQIKYSSQSEPPYLKPGYGEAAKTIPSAHILPRGLPHASSSSSSLRASTSSSRPNPTQPPPTHVVGFAQNKLATGSRPPFNQGYR